MGITSYSEETDPLDVFSRSDFSLGYVEYRQPYYRMLTAVMELGNSAALHSSNQATYSTSLLPYTRAKEQLLADGTTRMSAAEIALQKGGGEGGAIGHRLGSLTGAILRKAAQICPYIPQLSQQFDKGFDYLTKKHSDSSGNGAVGYIGGGDVRFVGNGSGKRRIID